LKQRNIPSVSVPNENRRGSVSDHTPALYCIVDDLLKAIGHKAIGHKDDCRCELTAAEVITAALVAVFNFGGKIERRRSCLHQTGLLPRMLSRARR
jgi:hypothetical protein